MKLIKPSRRLFLAKAAMAAPALIISPRLVEAFWQSRDTNYNKNVAGVSATTTWNPADKAANTVLSNGDLTATGSVSGTCNVRSIASYSSGKYHAEFTIGATNSTNYSRAVGIANSTASLTANLGNANSAAVFMGDPLFYINSGSTGSGVTYTNNDVVSMAVDLDNNTIWYRRNGGNWNGNASYDPATNTGGMAIATPTRPVFVIALLAISFSPNLTANFGATAYTYTAPSGFGNW